MYLSGLGIGQETKKMVGKNDNKNNCFPNDHCICLFQNEVDNNLDRIRSSKGVKCIVTVSSNGKNWDIY